MPSKPPMEWPSGTRPQKAYRLLIGPKEGGTSVDKLSIEFWREVLLYLQSDQRVVLAFTQACRFFYWIGTPILLKRLRYLSHHAFNLAHMNFWCTNKDSENKFHHFPLYLDFSVQPPCTNTGHLLEEGDSHEDTPNARTYNSIMSMIQNFANLCAIHIHDTTLPPRIYTVIGRLGKLRNCVFENCVFESAKRSEICLNFETLPLVSLTLRRVKGDWTKQEDSLPDPDTISPLHLSTGPRIRELALPWTTYASRFFAIDNYPPPTYPIPTKLKKIHICMEPESTPDDELSLFLGRQTKLEEVKLDASCFLKLAPQLFPRLRTVCVADCLEAYTFLVAGDKVHRLEITESCYGVFWLEEIASLDIGMTLATLSFKLSSWEPKVASLLSRACNGIEVVDIRVDQSISMKQLKTFKIVLPKLQKLRICSTTEDVPPIPVMDAKRIIEGWSQACPFLRSVQLSSRDLWRKDDQAWVRQHQSP